MAPGTWLRGPSVPEEDKAEEIALLGTDDDFDRLAQAARTYATEGEDDLDDDLEDDDEDEEEVSEVSTEGSEPPIGLAEETAAEPPQE